MFLDTTACIDLMREQRRRVDGPASRRVAGLGDAPVYVALFTVCELQAGARLSRYPTRDLREVQLLVNG